MNRRLPVFLYGGALLLLITFIAIQSKRSITQAQTDVDRHAEIVADSTWNVDPESIREYLQASAELLNYEHLAITLDSGETFIEVEAPYSKGTLNSFLHSLGLIPVFQLKADITYEENLIGQVQVRWYKDSIYAHIGAAIFLLLIATILTMWNRLVAHQRNLEGTVRERTEALRLEVDSHKKTNTELAFANDRFERIFDSAPLMGGVIDLNQGEILEVNQAFIEGTGHGPLDLVGSTLTDRGIFSSEEYANIKKTLNTDGAIRGRRCSFYHKDGTLRDGSLGAQILDMAGSPSFIILIEDITDRLEVEEKLHQSQKMDAVGKLAAGIAHDFNNMLGAILGATGMLEKHIESSEKAKRYHDIITSSVTRASGLVSKISAFTRKADNEMEIIDLHQVIDDTVVVLTSTVDRRISITCTKSATSHAVAADASQIQSVLMNLGINASHAISGTGRISIETRNITLSKDAPNNSTRLLGGDYIQVEISDTGCGIPPENLIRIFEPFFTTKAKGKGTGLGLSSALEAIRSHQGDIRVHSVLDSGTRFTIQLPIVEKPQTRDDETMTIRRGRGCVLVVDDERDMRDTTAAILDDLGYTTMLASDGHEAVEVYKKHGSKIDIVLLDMVMPKVDGLTCFETLKSLNPEVRAILLSGYCKEEDLQRMQDLGVLDFVRKPFGIASLSKAVAKGIKR